MLENGVIDEGKYGWFYSSYFNSWWKVINDEVDLEYTDLYYSPGLNSWWKITNGMVDLGYTGWYYSPGYGWWYIYEYCMLGSFY